MYMCTSSTTVGHHNYMYMHVQGMLVNNLYIPMFVIIVTLYSKLHVPPSHCGDFLFLFMRCFFIRACILYISIFAFLHELQEMLLSDVGA